MFSSRISIIFACILSVTIAQHYRNQHYRYQGYGNYRNPHGTRYQTTYQGYRSPYNSYYNNYYAQAQPSSYQYYGSGDKYIGNGVHVDSHGNGYIGAKDTGLYIFCASRGCVGRG
ncbi:unnamed protein product [Caenorhabditis nigoni]